MLDQLLPAELYAFLLVFARVAAALMVMPGFGEVFVSPRVRLLLALAVAVVLTPVVEPILPGLPDGPVAYLLALGGEIGIGLFLGAIARFLVSALHTAGVVVGFQTSLANAQLFDPSTAEQGSMLAAFLNLLGVFLILAADLHHLLLGAIAESYFVFAPGGALPVGDFTEVAARTVARSFALGLQIAAPFIVVGMIFYLGLGLLARLMPQVQVFFIALPLQILLGFLVMAITISAIMLWFLGSFEGGMLDLIGRS